nr:hypothetical protein [Campylobacter jejuni]
MQDKEQDNLTMILKITQVICMNKKIILKNTSLRNFAVGGLLFIFLMVYFLKSFSGNNNDIEEAPKEEIMI